MNNVYKLDVEDYVVMSTKEEKVQSSDVNEIFRRRLGHLHYGALKIMQHINTIIPKGALEKKYTWKGCTLGKYTKATFYDRDIKAHVVLERIHFGVCGHFSTTSTIGHKYFVIFIDDYSWKCWIFFMQNKDDTLSKFLIKVLRVKGTDGERNGQEGEGSQ